MKKYAIIDGQKVVNVIEYETPPSHPISGLDSHLIAIQSDIAGPGWTYVNEQFVAPPASIMPPMPTISTPTLAELQAQLATITAQINALAGVK